MLNFNMAEVTEEQKHKIFNRLKKVLLKYQKYFTATLDTENTYTLVSIKELTILGRKRSDIAFASILIQKNYVTLYYMPIYAFPHLASELIPEEILKLKNGKSCFGFKSIDNKTLKLIDVMLQKGRDCYQDAGWV